MTLTLNPFASLQTALTGPGRISQYDVLSGHKSYSPRRKRGPA